MTGCAIGLDIGGTKIAAGIVVLPEGRVLARRLIPAGAHRQAHAVLADAVAMARELLVEAEALGLQPQGIGVGVPELVDRHGAITSSQNFAWRGMLVREAFAELAPTSVDADVRMAARAEAALGLRREVEPWIYLTVGTGISYVLVQDGRPYAGARGNALVCGSAPLSTTCTTCGSELHPVLEEIASGPALVARFDRERPGRAQQAPEVLAAARDGDEAAIAVVTTAGAALGVTAAFLVNTLDPARLVVGGGLGLAGGLYWDTFVAATRAHIWADQARSLPIEPASLGVDAGLIGAALSAWNC